MPGGGARIWSAVVALALGAARGAELDGAWLVGMSAVSILLLTRRRTRLRLVALALVAFVAGATGAGARTRAATEAAAGRAPAGPFGIAAAVRTGLATAAHGLDDRRGALLRGLVAGDKTSIDRSTTEAFRRSGLAHLLAVSGSNVAIVAGAAMVVVARAGLRLRVAFGLIAVLLYGAVVGPEPSVLRAAAMGVVTLGAMGWGVRADPLRTLGLALIFVIGSHPEMVSSVGLHLSAAATAGIVVWTRPFATRLHRLPRGIALPLAATLAAQCAVAPLLVGTFGQMSLSAPVANLLALPAVAPATILGLIAAVAGVLSADWGRRAAALAGPFLSWILGVADALGRPSWASLSVPRGVGWWLGAGACLGAAAALRRSGSDSGGVKMGR